MTIKSRRPLFFLPISINVSDICARLPVEGRAFLMPKKIFLKNLKFGVSFLGQNRAVGKCRVQILRRTLTIEYTFIRYVAWAMGEPLSRTKVRQDSPAAYGISGT